MPRFFRKVLTYPLIWIVILFIIVPLLGFPEIIFGGQTLYWSDLSWIHYPRHIFAAEEWLAGRMPLWDPYQHNGLPFLAETQVGVLYPLSILFLSNLSPSLELSLFIVLHFTLAALFTFTLARSLAMSYPAATVAGLSFGYGGFLMAQVANLNIMTGAAWLPLILYGLIETTKRRTWLTAMLAGLPLAFQILTSQPQIVFYTLLTIGSYGLYRLGADFFFNPGPQQKNVSYLGRTILLLGGVVLTALLLAAPQWLSTLELQQLSVRSAERGWEFLTQNSYAPALWLNLFVPSAFGNNVVGFNIGDPFQEDFIYAGFIPLLLIFFSPAQRNKRDMPFFLLLLIGGMFLAMGRYTPFYHYLIQYLPGFSLFRVPSRWLMLVNLALAILAGFGLETLRQKGLSKSQLIAVLCACIFLITSLTLAWLFRANLQAWSSHWSNINQKLLLAFFEHAYTVNPIYQENMVLSHFIQLTIPTFLLLVNLIVAASLFILYGLGRIRANTFTFLIIVALTVDLIAAGGTVINPTKADDWWHQLSASARYVLENVGEARVFPLGMGSEQATVSHFGQYFPSVYRIRSAGGHGSSLMLNRTNIFLKQAHPVQAIRTLGVRYLLTEGQMGADTAATFPLVYNDESGFVYENKTPLPRTFIVHQAVQVTTSEEALAIFQNSNLNLAQTVVLETTDILPPVQPSITSTATILTETASTIKIGVMTDTAGYLLLLDTFYPGWTATINGQFTPIYRANYIGRAIFVPQGKHIIEFVYWPYAFRLGLWFALLVLIIIISLVFNNIVQRSDWTKP